MSILSDLLRDVAALFFPPRCPVCGVPLAQGERTVCTLCRTTAPLTGFWLEADNPLLAKCRDMLPVERASGFLYYIHGSGWRELIRGFKYRGAWRTARAMGEWYGRCLKESGRTTGWRWSCPCRCIPSSGAGGGTTSRSTSPRGSPRSWARRWTAGASAANAIRRVRPSNRGANAPATSTRLSRCAVPNGSKGGTSCWWTTSSRRQHDAFVRWGDAARRTRMPDQHRGTRRLAAGAGGEGVIGN